MHTLELQNINLQIFRNCQTLENIFSFQIQIQKNAIYLFTIQNKCTNIYWNHVEWNVYFLTIIYLYIIKQSINLSGTFVQLFVNYIFFDITSWIKYNLIIIICEIQWLSTVFTKNVSVQKIRYKRVWNLYFHWSQLILNKKQDLWLVWWLFSKSLINLSKRYIKKMQK